MKKLDKETRNSLWKVIVPYSLTNILMDCFQFILIFLLSILMNKAESSLFQGDIKDHYVVGILLVSPLLISGIVYKVKSFLLVTVNQCIVNLFERFQNKPLDNVEKNSPAEWEYKLERLYPMYLWSYIDIFSFSINLFFLILVLSLIAVRISMLGFLIVLLLALFNSCITNVFYKTISKYKGRSLAEDEELQGFEMDGIANAYSLDFFRLKNLYVQRHNKKIEYIKSQIKIKEKLAETCFELFLNYYGILSKLIIISVPLFIENVQGISGTVVMLYYMYDLMILGVEKVQKIIKSKNELKIYDESVDALTAETERNLVLCSKQNDLILEARNLSYAYLEEVFSGVNIEVRQGDKVLITGKNGSGKSTLLKVLSGQYQGYAGTIRINGKEVEKQSNNISEDFSFAHSVPIIISDNVLENIKLKRKIDDNIMHQYMSLFDAEKLMDRELKASELDISGGEAQKISLIRSLVEKKKIIFWDEPTNNLDNESRNNMIEIFNNPEYTIIYTSHDDELRKYANKMVILEES